MAWHKIPELLSGLHEIIIGDKKICVVKKDENLFACAGSCPHAGGVMASGYVDALNNIVCPVHHYRFSLKNGRNTSGEGYSLKTYPVECREDGWFIELS